MSKSRFVIFGILAAIALVLLPFLALKAEGEKESAIVHVESRDEADKEIFETNCGTCHTFAAGGSDGVVGPDLDDLLITSGANSAEQYEASYTRVLAAVTCGKGGRMPKGILVGEESKRVSRFVAAYAAQIGAGPVMDTATAPMPPPQPCPEL